MPPKPPTIEPIDLNILPEQYRPRVVAPAIVLVWVIAAVLVVLLVPGALIARSHRNQVRALEADLWAAEETLTAIRTPAPEVVALTDELSRTVRALNAAQNAVPTALATHRNWEPIFQSLLDYDPARIRLIALNQHRDDLTLTGHALTQEDVLAYAGGLERSGHFGQVIVQAMERISLPTATPPYPLTASPTIDGAATPGTGQATVTLYDAYEPDDYEPKAVPVGEVQWRTFSPLYDVDRATFLGKAGRRYCIQAVPGAVGVDTVLEVAVGQTGYVNDDCHPSETTLLGCRCPASTVPSLFASMVEAQVPAGADQQVQITVRNRGEYGVQQHYTLLVSELPGDPWETDDQNPKLIAVGEAQPRTFYPDGDVDRVYWPVKAGYSYELRTASLAVGVDTVLTVQANGVTYHNDDVAPGDASSRVQFDATVDGIASATVTNKGLYGHDRAYTLHLLSLGGDAYEPDDYTPSAISHGEQQRRSFFPAGDIDRVEFNVKAGRVYEMRTVSLTVGVDTVLSVLVAGITHSNDDVAPGDPSSRVTFTAPTDGRALATITNRDQFGPNREYGLWLYELAGTPTPDLTRTPGPSPTHGPSPTPDCGDPYEPDDFVARYMAVGEEWVRNLCPAGDVDRAVFTAKAGYAYQVETLNLAVGVDTVLTVQLGGDISSNDDRSPQDLSSAVQVQNQGGTDLPAFVTVTNKGSFGQSMTYALRVTNLGTGDAFEVDDLEPVPIALGQPQQRTFYPAGDVDQALFTAKAGHRYRVFTTNLAPYVDTALRVTMGALEITNDDRVPGDLSSYVEIQNTTGQDSQVTVLVTNNGQYGPDRSYALQVDDLGAIGGDAYEPDIEVKRYISVGDVQRRTFHPENDIDRVTLQVKAGRRYVVYTCGNPYAEGTPAPTTTPFSDTVASCLPLVPGVDTVLMALGPIQECAPSSCQSDDASPGSGQLNSRVEFEAIVDGEVVITCYNKGLFGPAQEYYLFAGELAAAPNTPAPPTPTPYFSPTPTATFTPVPPSATPTVTSTPTPTPTPSATSDETPAAALGTPRLMVAAPAPTSRARIGLAASARQATTAVPFGAGPGETVIQFTLLLKLGGVTP